MKWTIKGVDRETGEARTLTVGADDERSAAKAAADRGVMATSIRRVRPTADVTPGGPSRLNRTVAAVACAAMGLLVIVAVGTGGFGRQTAPAALVSGEPAPLAPDARPVTRAPDAAPTLGVSWADLSSTFRGREWVTWQSQLEGGVLRRAIVRTGPIIQVTADGDEHDVGAVTVSVGFVDGADEHHRALQMFAMGIVLGRCLPGDDSDFAHHWVGEAIPDLARRAEESPDLNAIAPTLYRNGVKATLVGSPAPDGYVMTLLIDP